MKVSYLPKYHPTEGTVYKQTFRISKEENRKLFDNMFKEETINYGNAYTSSWIASKIHDLPEYAKQLKRIVIANSVVVVDK